MENYIKLLKFEDGGKEKVYFHRSGTCMFHVKREQDTIIGQIAYKPYFHDMYVMNFVVPLKDIGYTIDLRNFQDIETIYYYGLSQLVDKNCQVYSVSQITEAMLQKWFN